jgi:hypothetical protein
MPAYIYLFAAQPLKPRCLVTNFDQTNALRNYERFAIHQL